MRSISAMSTPVATTNSAGPAGVARRDVARRRLALEDRLSPLREEVALVDGVIDEIPRQRLVGREAAVDVRVRGRAAAEPAAANGSLDDRPEAARVLVHGDQERREAAVAPREQGLPVRLA